MVAKRAQTTKSKKDKAIYLPDGALPTTFEIEDEKRKRFSPTGRSPVEKKIR